MTLSLFAKFLSLLGYPQRFVSPFVPLSSVVPFILTGTTAETSAYTGVIPAGTLKVGSRVRITVFAMSNTGRTGFWQYRTYINNVALGGQNNATTLSGGSTVYSAFVDSATTMFSTGAMDGSTNTVAPLSIPINLAADTPVKITMTNAAATDTTKTAAFFCEITNP